MRRLAVGCALFAGLACLAGPASAETVYRCGPGSYSQLPCHEGRTVDASDRRSADDVADGKRVAQMERKLGDSLERERLQQEGTPQRTSSLSPPPGDKQTAQKASKSKNKKVPKDFSIKLPKPKKNAS
jgi:hypothetical protein